MTVPPNAEHATGSNEAHVPTRKQQSGNGVVDVLVVDVDVVDVVDVVLVVDVDVVVVPLLHGVISVSHVSIDARVGIPHGHNEKH
jgi:hypothetical protein